MKVLFIHQNFPGQYLHLAQHLRDNGHTVIGLGETVNIRNRGTIPGITTVGYETPTGPGARIHHYLSSTEAAVRRGQTVARSLLTLREKGMTPDVISVHPGWGEGLFVRDVFPDVPILMFCEFFFHAGEADLAFDPEFPTSVDKGFSIRIKNTPQIVSLTTADACLSPTRWQAGRYPASLVKNLHIIHDGVNVNYMSPDNNDSLLILRKGEPGEGEVLLHGSEEAARAEAEGLPVLRLSKKDKVITYIGRNLEPYRGFHAFLRALPELQQRRPDAHVLIVGSSGVSYSPHLPQGETYKSKYLREVGSRLDLSRIHFLDRIPYAALRSMFRISSAHVYLTYPFVLSWSTLEAMSCQGLVLASRTEPVEEVIRDNENGLLFNFFDQQGMLECIDKVLTNPGAYEHIRQKARETILKKYELDSCLKKQAKLLEQMAQGKYKGHWRRPCPVEGL